MFEFSIRRTYELLFEQMCQARRNKVDIKVSLLTRRSRLGHFCYSCLYTTSTSHCGLLYPILFANLTVHLPGWWIL